MKKPASKPVSRKGYQDGGPVKLPVKQTEADRDKALGGYLGLRRQRAPRDNFGDALDDSDRMEKFKNLGKAAPQSMDVDKAADVYRAMRPDFAKRMGPMDAGIDDKMRTAAPEVMTRHRDTSVSLRMPKPSEVELRKGGKIGPVITVKKFIPIKGSTLGSARVSKPHFSRGGSVKSKSGGRGK